MPRSPTRSRLRPFLLLTLFILAIIYLTTGSRSTQTSDFYTRTVAAVDARQKSLREGLSGALEPAAKAQAEAEAKVRDGSGELVLPKVKEHGDGKGETVSGKEKKQKVLADEDEDGDGEEDEGKKSESVVQKAKSKAKELADEVVKNGKKKKKGSSSSSSKGKKKTTDDEDDDADDNDDDADADAVHGPKKPAAGSAGKKVQGKPDSDDGVAKVGNTEKHVKDKTKGKNKASKGKDKSEAGSKREGSGSADDSKTVGDHEAEVVLDGILKKSPIIIFSKSACPFSQKAKRIFRTYKIVPAPYVEELDRHPLGDRLQAALYKMTGRKTVPNIMINGKSIGGGDDVEDLDKEDKLADKITALAGKRVMEVTKLNPNSVKE